MWHSLGLGLGLGVDGADRASAHAHDAGTVNALKEELLEAARSEVVDARAKSGAYPTVVDRVLRGLDARGTDG